MFVNYVGWCSAEKRCGKKLSMLGSYCVLRGNFFGQEGGGLVVLFWSKADRDFIFLKKEERKSGAELGWGQVFS